MYKERICFVFLCRLLRVFACHGETVKTQQFDVSDSSKEASHWSTPFADCESLRCLLLPVKFQTIEFLTLQKIANSMEPSLTETKILFSRCLIFGSNQICSKKTPLDNISLQLLSGNYVWSIAFSND